MVRPTAVFCALLMAVLIMLPVQVQPALGQPAAARGPHDQDFISQAILAPDGRTLAVGITHMDGAPDFTGVKSVIKVLDVQTGRLLKTLTLAPREVVWSLAYSPYGSTLASAGYFFNGMAVTRCEISLWDMPTGKLRRQLEQPQWVNPIIAFSPDGSKLLSGGRWIKAPQQKGLHLWNVQTGQVELTLPLDAGTTALAFAPDGATIASATWKMRDDASASEIQLWNSKSGELNQKLDVPSVLIHSLSFSPNGKVLVSSSDNMQGRKVIAGKQIKVWDIPGGELKQTVTMKAHHIPLGPVAFLNDNSRLAIANWPAGLPQDEDNKWAPENMDNAPNEVRVWDVPFRSVQQFIRIPLEPHGWATTGSFSADGNKLVLAYRDGTIQLWDMETGGLSRSMRAFDLE